MRAKHVFWGPVSMKSRESVAVYLCLTSVVYHYCKDFNLFKSAILICHSLNQEFSGTSLISSSFPFSLCASSLLLPQQYFTNSQSFPLFYSVSHPFLSLSSAVGRSGGEVLLTGRDSLPEGEAEPLRLSRRLHHCHHRQEAAAASESDGAATGGELQVGVTVAEERHFEIYIIFLSFKKHWLVMLTSCGLADQGWFCSV